MESKKNIEKVEFYLAPKEGGKLQIREDDFKKLEDKMSVMEFKDIDGDGFIDFFAVGLLRFIPKRDVFVFFIIKDGKLYAFIPKTERTSNPKVYDSKLYLIGWVGIRFDLWLEDPQTGEKGLYPGFIFDNGRAAIKPQPTLGMRARWVKNDLPHKVSKTKRAIRDKAFEVAHGRTPHDLVGALLGNDMGEIKPEDIKNLTEENVASLLRLYESNFGLRARAKLRGEGLVGKLDKKIDSETEAFMTGQNDVLVRVLEMLGQKPMLERIRRKWTV